MLAEIQSVLPVELFLRPIKQTYLVSVPFISSSDCVEFTLNIIEKVIHYYKNTYFFTNNLKYICKIITLSVFEVST